jgi:ABC-type polysaccharide/polyol phosphate export permease
VLALPLALVPWILVTAGAAMATAAVSVHFRDMRDLLGHVLNLLFFGSPIIYSLEGLDLPGPLATVLSLNPMVSIIAVYRNVAFADTLGSLTDWGLAMATGVVVWLLGAAVFDRLRDTIVEAV